MEHRRLPRTDSAPIPTFMLAAAPRAHNTIDYTLILHSAGACVWASVGLLPLCSWSGGLSQFRLQAHVLTCTSCDCRESVTYRLAPQSFQAPHNFMLSHPCSAKHNSRRLNDLTKARIRLHLRSWSPCTDTPGTGKSTPNSLHSSMSNV